MASRPVTEREWQWLRNKAERGAKRLDKYEPGWFRKVNIELLDLSDPCVCIVGQVIDAEKGCSERIYDAFDKEYGFSAPRYNGPSQEDIYKAMDVIWIELIKERFANAILEGSDT